MEASGRRALLWLLPLLLVALCFCAPAAAAELQDAPDVQVLQFGWQADGTLAPRGWNPVLVRVAGANEDSARVQVTLRSSVASGTQTFITPVAIYAQDVALPQGVTRDVKLWVPLQADGAYLVTAQLLDAQGHVLAEQSTVSSGTTRADAAPLVATLADSPTLATELAHVEVPYQQGLTAQVRSVQLQPADVPTRADYLSGFQALVVQGTGPTTLTSEQKRAVQQWVVQGGELVIVGGPDAGRAAALLDGADALGLTFTGLNASADLQPLASWAAADSGPGPGVAALIRAPYAEPLAGPREQPLAARASWGDGTVVLLAVDPTQDPLRGWGGTTALLRQTLQLALASPSISGPDLSRYSLPLQQARHDDARLLAAVDALPSNAFPDWQHVALLLGTFAFVVGPILHGLLWRTGRRPWLWVAVPGLAIATTAGMYLVTAVQPGHDVVANVISEVRVDPTTGDARQALAVGYFAPLREQLSVHIGGEVPVRVASGVSGLSGGPSIPVGLGSGTLGTTGRSATGATLPGFRVVTGRDTQIDFTSNATLQNGLRSLVLSRGLPGGSFGQLDADLHVDGADGVVRGTVRNATPYALDEVGLAIGQTIARLGPMAAGQTTSVSFDPRTSPPSAPGNLPYSFAWQLFGVASSRSGAGPSGALDLPSDPEVRRRVKVVDAVFSAGDRNAPIAYSASGLPIVRPSAVRPMLVAITSDAVGGDVLPNAGAQRTFQETVIEMPVHLTIAPGRFTLASALLTPTLGLESGASINPGGSTSPAWLDLRGSATYTFRAELPVNARVDRLNVTTQQAGAGAPQTGPGAIPQPRPVVIGPSSAGTFSAYDWHTGTWQPLAAGSREVALDPPEDFVGPDGSVRIQVASGGADRVVRFLPPEVTLQGETGT